MGTFVMSAPSAQRKFDVGSIVGDYQLVKQIDNVFAGEAFLATYRDGDLAVVLHVCPIRSFNVNKADRVIDSIRRIQDIVHPFLARTIQVFPFVDRVCVATQCNDGNSLAEMVATDGPVPPELVYGIIRQVALALKCIHDHGHAHHAVEPRTIFLQASGDVQVLGLGLAMLYRDNAYGAHCHSRCDLVSLGEVAGFLLAGHAKYDDELLPQSWRPIVKRMTASQADQGYTSIDDAIHELGRSFDPAWVEEAPPTKPLSLVYAESGEASIYRTDALSPSTPSFRSWLLASCRQLFHRR